MNENNMKWNRWYLAVLFFLILQIIIFYLITGHFR
jgi:hypothetical protein